VARVLVVRPVQRPCRSLRWSRRGGPSSLPFAGWWPSQVPP